LEIEGTWRLQGLPTIQDFIPSTVNLLFFHENLPKGALIINRPGQATMFSSVNHFLAPCDAVRIGRHAEAENRPLYIFKLFATTTSLSALRLSMNELMVRLFVRVYVE
jgi:hypothetical protein